MPIVSNFPSGGGTGGGGLQLAAVSNITTKVSHGKVYVKWTDPEDLVVAESTLAEWAGTLLVRKAGSMPVSRRDGTVVVDSKVRNQYQNQYFCDSGLSDGTVYYYKFFPYTTTNTYTENEDCEFTETPNAPVLGNVSGMSAAPAGNGKLAVKWTDPAATIVEDGLTLATWEKTTVVVKAGGYATSPDDEDAAYTLAVTTRNQYSSNPLVVTGLTNGTTYYVSFFPETTDGAVNVNASNRISGEANRMVIATVPSQSGSLTYNGSAQTPSWSNYDTTKMTLSVTGQTNAGTYSASFTPKDDYMWSDETTAAKQVNWTINKAAGSLSVNPTTVTLDMEHPTAQITVTRAGTGAITAQSNNTGIVTTSVSGNVITVHNVNQTSGDTTITVKVAADNNYNAPADKTVTVNAKFVSNTLNENDWSVIKTVSDSGQGDNYWDIGDTKTIVINGKVGNFTFNNLSIDAFIIGFNHNSSREGSNRIHFQIGKIGGKMVGLVDSQYNNYQSSNGYFNMNPNNSNSGGWNNSYMRKTLLGNTNSPTSPLANSLMAALPSDLRAVMKSVTKFTDNTANGGGNQSSYVTATTDYLWLLAEFEVQGSRTYANSYEKNYQQRYEYYSKGNSKVAYRHSATGSTAWWWLRSAYYNYTNRFCSVWTDGSAASNYARISGALLPGFAV